MADARRHAQNPEVNIRPSSPGEGRCRRVADGDGPMAVSLDGEIVQIITTGSVSSLRVALRHLVVFDAPPRLVHELHLGDRIAIDGALRVDALRPLPAASEPESAG